MARLKRSSAVLETARQRLSGLKNITPKPNFGPTLNLEQYEQEIDACEQTLNQYNDTIALLDRLANDLEAAEEQLREKNQRMLSATRAYYGPDSNEYETVGGVRTSDRKPPSRKKPKTD
ncbi:MAG: hypothetical protein JOZ96_22985 [Acidobacteria bacterium]|nr:hypothetical protein [Acidobacteriota bacterium]